MCETAGLAVRIFPAITRTFTKNTALSQQGRGAAWHVWINTRHGHGILCVNPPLWCYSPFWSLASTIRSCHSSLNSARLLHPPIPSTCDVSIRITSSHLVFGFPTGLVLWNFPLTTSFWDPFIFHSHNTTHTLYIIHDILIFVWTINFTIPSKMPLSFILYSTIYSP